MYAASTPFWITAARRVKRIVTNRYVPLLAIGAAYCFLVMMFNIPVPDGTTAHATGAVLVAVLLGPSAAVIAVSIALLIQALFFGDGGVLAFGANCFNMAIVGPLIGYAVYKTISTRSAITSPRRAVAAGLGAYVGINVAAVLTALEFGIQPRLFTRADGTPLYSPFDVSQALPPMLLAHLFVAGVVEFILTAGVITYLQRANTELMVINHDVAHAISADESSPDAIARSPQLPRSQQPSWRWAVVGLGFLALLTPLGLIAPGEAFGEEAPDDLDLQKYKLDAVPNGLRHYAGFFHNALFDGYSYSNDSHPAIAYVVSAAFGVLAIAVTTLVVFKMAQLIRQLRLRHRERRGAHA